MRVRARAPIYTILDRRRLLSRRLLAHQPSKRPTLAVSAPCFFVPFARPPSPTFNHVGRRMKWRQFLFRQALRPFSATLPKYEPCAPQALHSLDNVFFVARGAPCEEVVHQ